jgi:hypothetical protein
MINIELLIFLDDRNNIETAFLVNVKLPDIAVGGEEY